MDEANIKKARPGPAIVVAGYNRVASLSRLLNSLLNGFYDGFTVPLHISIDQGYANDVVELVEAFAWPFGPKEITLHPEHLGLKGHILWCGDLSQRYGEIILLEDDLFVSPPFYDFAVRALRFYRDDRYAAGISLYHYEVAESSGFPFQPFHGGYDVYCMEWPSSWGLAISAGKWAQFRDWQQVQSEEVIHALLPAFVRKWEAGSWKRLMVAYLIKHSLVFVYPRISLTTHFGDPGTHSVKRGSQQSPLLAECMDWKFCESGNVLSHYDAWFELGDLELRLLRSEFQHGPYFDIDLYGCKELEDLKNEWVLTSRWIPPEVRSDSSLVRGNFAMDLLPPIQNVILGLQGSALHIVQKSVLKDLDKHPSQFLQHLSGKHQISDSPISQSGLSFSILVPESGSQQENELTVASVLKVDYPQLEVVAIAPGNPPASPDERIRVLSWPAGAGYWQALELGFKASSGDVVICLHPGQTLAPDVLIRATALMAEYSEIDWLLLRMPQLELPANRWSLDRFARARRSTVRSHLGPGFSLVRRGLWLKLGGNFQSGEDFLTRLFGEVVPYSADLEGARGREIDSESWGPLHPPRRDFRAERSWAGWLVSRMARPFFLANGGLRWLHMELEQYPPVIRWDADAEKWSMQRY